MRLREERDEAIRERRGPMTRLLSPRVCLLLQVLRKGQALCCGVGGNHSAVIPAGLNYSVDDKMRRQTPR